MEDADFSGGAGLLDWIAPSDAPVTPPILDNYITFGLNEHYRVGEGERERCKRMGNIKAANAEIF